MPDTADAAKTKKLTSGRLLARNTVWNVIGQVVPYLVAIISIPVLISSLGTERFGILTLVWLIIGYFNLFNLGLGRALTQLVSERMGKGTDEEIPELTWTGLFLMFMLGLTGTVVLMSLASWIVHSVLNIPEELQADTVNTFYMLAISIPAIVCTDGLTGILSASQRFDLINAVRIPMSTFVYAGPLMVLPFSHSLVPIAAVLVTSRILTAGVYLLMCLKVMPYLRHTVRIKLAMLKPLIRFGGWMTISNVINPFMVTMDRFFIGALISAYGCRLLRHPLRGCDQVVDHPHIRCGGAVSRILRELCARPAAHFPALQSRRQIQHDDPFPDCPAHRFPGPRGAVFVAGKRVRG